MRWGAWLVAAPLLLAAEPELLSVTLRETTTQMAEKLGRPAQTGEASPGYFSWFLQTDVADHHEYSHVLLFRHADRTLVSLTRNFEEPRVVDELFPAAESRTFYWRAEGQPDWPVRVRCLSGDRVLIAMGVEKPGQRTNQLLLIRREELVAYLPWLAKQL